MDWIWWWNPIRDPTFPRYLRFYLSFLEEEDSVPAWWIANHLIVHFLPRNGHPRNHRFFETSSSNFRKREDGLSTMDFSQFSKTRGWPVDDERFADSSCFAVSRGSRDRKSERVDLSRSIFLANAGLHINWKLKAGILWDIVKDWSAHFRANPRGKCIWTRVFLIWRNIGLINLILKLNYWGRRGRLERGISLIFWAWEIRREIQQIGWWWNLKDCSIECSDSFC